MAREQILKKSYINHLGLDFKSSDLVREDGYATEMKNAQYRRSGSIESRSGYQCVAGDKLGGDRVGGFGIYSYNRVYPFDIDAPTVVSGQADPKLVSLAKDAYVLKKTTLSILYSGTSEGIQVSMIFDPEDDEYKFRIVDTILDSTLADIGLGKGINEASPYTIANLQADLITAGIVGPDFTVTLGEEQDDTIAAAFLRIRRNYDLPAGETVVFDAYAWELIRSNFKNTVLDPRTDPFEGSEDRKATDTFENISSVQINNVIYFSNGYDDVMKYDGSFLYRAGLPTPDTTVEDKANDPLLFAYDPPLSSSGSGLVPEQFYSYKIQYEQRDNAGNIYESNVASLTVDPTEQLAATVSANTTLTAAPYDIPVTGNITVGGEQIIFRDTSTDSYIKAVVLAAGTTGTNIRLDVSAPSNTVNCSSGETVTSFSVTNGLKVFLQAPVPIVVPMVVDSRGFNTNRATVNGAVVASTTIVVDAPNIFQRGDIVTFVDSSTGAYLQASVSSATNTSITISNIFDLITGDAQASVTVPDNSIITNGLSIRIYRSNGFDDAEAAEAANHRLIGYVQNVGSSTVGTFTDTKTDFQIADQEILIDPLFDRSPPPRGKYLTAFRNNLIIASLKDSLDAVAFSEEFPEYFPAGRNEFTVESSVGDNVSGVASNNNVLCVFKDDSIHTVSGDINNLSFRVEPLTNDIGCVSHASIKEVGGLLYFMSDSGPYKMVGGQIPQSVGDGRLDPVFNQFEVSDDEKFRYKRAISFNDTEYERWILLVPTETNRTLPDTTDWKSTNSDHRAFACDYYRPDVWLEWSNYDISCGAVKFDGEMYFMGRIFDTNSSDVRVNLFRRLNNNDSMDYEDNTEKVDFVYAGNWEAIGEPSVFKKFHRMRLFSLEENNNNELNLNIKTEVNYSRGATRSDFDFVFTALGYGVSDYGDDPYGDVAELAEYRSLAHGKFRSMRIIFSNNDHQKNNIITGWEVEISPVFGGKFKK